MNNNGNKQFLAVMLFFIFIGVCIILLAFSSCESKFNKIGNNSDNNKNSNEVIENSNSNEVEGSESVEIITSNPNISNSNIPSNNTSNNNTKPNSNSNNKPNNSNNTSNSNNSNSNSNNNYIPVSYFTTKLNSNKIYVGNSTNIIVNIHPSNATNKNVTYTSSNSKIATVSSNGVVKGIKAGTVTITVKVENAGVANVDVTVVAVPIIDVPPTPVVPDDIPVKSVSISPKEVSVSVGGNAQFSHTISPSTATNKGVTWKSSNTNVATVNSSGVVTGVKEGSATITVTTKDGAKKDSATVIVSKKTVPVTGVSLNKSSVTLNQDYSTTLVATITPSDATNKTVSWSSSNTSVATVSNTGVVKGIKGGTATITVTTSDGNKKATCTVTVKGKNGWYTENGNRYYYNNGIKVTNDYVDYIYLNSEGIAQPKIGNFSATLYGARAWANQQLNIRSSASSSSSKLGTVPVGGKMTILSVEDSNTRYIKIRYGSTEGYVFSDYIYINLPDVIPDAIYEITNASSSIYKSADQNIPGITGTNLYGFTKSYNNKIDKNTYYAPLLYPVAKQFQRAYDKARGMGYNLKLYDTYRPYPVSTKVNAQFKTLYNSNQNVRSLVDKDKDGASWGTSWFLANGVSNHNRGIAIDLALTNNSGTELSAQVPMHTLDTRAVRKYNNSNAKTLSDIMTSVGFDVLDSEWWHYEEKSYNSSPYTSFYIN